MKEDFQLKFKHFVKRIAKHAKWAVSFRIKNNETCETDCFAKHEISRNGQIVSRNNETRFASSFAKQKAKRVSLETLAIVLISAIVIGNEISLNVSVKCDLGVYI
jgi:hypothetical protein